MRTRAPDDGGSPADALPRSPDGAGTRRRAARTTGKGRSRRSPSSPSSEPTVSTPPAFPLHVADSGALVGRQAELAQLRRLWDDARRGSMRVALVGGEPGMGKTRLVAELAGIAQAEGAVVLVGGCERDVASPYGPFVDALRSRLAGRSPAWVGEHVDRHGPELVALFSELAQPLEGTPPESPGGSRTRLLSAIAAVLGDVEPREPVLLVLEDLHWATCSTALALDHVAREHGRRAMMVVATYRDGAIHPSHPLAAVVDGLLSEQRVERLILTSLSPQAVAALLVDRAALAGRAAAVLARELWRTTEGHPFLLTEVVHDLARTGAVVDGTVQLDADIAIPHDVAELVSHRLERRSPARTAVDAAAVVGTDFTAATVAALTERKEDQVRAALARAAAARLVVESDPGSGAYRFVHDLVRETLYWSLPANRRIRLHRRLADALQREDGEGRSATSPAVLVHHLSSAAPVGRTPEAVVPASQAGDAAMGVLAFEEAAEFYGQALAFLGGAGDAATRTDLLIALAEANHRAGESARARQSYLQAAAVARKHQDGPRLGRAVLGLGEVVGVWGADGLLIGLLEQALTANPEDASLRAKLLGRLAQARAAFDSPDQRKAQSDRAWELAWDSRDPDTMGAVLRARHEALSSPDDLEDRVEIDGELVAMATASDDEELALLAHGWRLVDVLEQGHLVDADRDREIHAKLARRRRDARHQRDAALWAGMRELLAGRPRRASTHIDRALLLGQKLRDPEAASAYWVQQLALLLDWGDDAELDGLVEVWRDLVRRHDRDPAWRASLALLLARTGRRDEAGEELEDLLADDCADLPLDRTWLPTVGAIAETAATIGDRRAAPLLAKLLNPYGRRLLVVGPGLVCRGSVARVLGMVWATTDTWAEAERHFQAALSIHEHLAAPPLIARARADFGAMLARQPGGPLHVGRARTTLAQARDEAMRAGMARLTSEVDTILQGLAPAPAPRRSARRPRAQARAGT